MHPLPFRSIIVPLVAGAAILAVACGDDGAPRQANTTTTAAVTATTTTAATEPATRATSAATSPSSAITVTPASTGSAAATAAAALPAPDCAAGAATTLAQTEGPFYKPNPPQRASLIEAGVTGMRLVLTGYVLTAECTPVAGARVDFWQADAQGAYDNAGYRLRGYQLTDAQGRYGLETIMPAEYSGRTAHIHVKVNAPGGPVLTSQLYIPEAARNQQDSIFRPELLLKDVRSTPEGMTGRFDFVVRAR